MADVDAAKADLRRRLRIVRSDLVVEDAQVLRERSRRIVERLVALEDVAAARLVFGYRSLPGEVGTESLEQWCGAAGVAYRSPDATPDAAVPPGVGTADVLVAPALGFDRAGGRLGQGGGWYDRVLAHGRPGLVVGLAFREQMVDRIPMGDLDVRVDCVVDDDGAWWAS